MSRCFSAQEEEEFVDGEAGEDGEEGEGDGEGEPEGEDASADSSEEEEGSEQNEYEADGFVVDEEDAEDGDGEGGEASDQEAVRKKRKKRRRDKQFALDEEDYDLLEEAVSVRVWHLGLTLKPVDAALNLGRWIRP